MKTHNFLLNLIVAALVVGVTSSVNAVDVGDWFGEWEGLLDEQPAGVMQDGKYGDDWKDCGRIGLFEDRYFKRTLTIKDIDIKTRAVTATIDGYGGGSFHGMINDEFTKIEFKEPMVALYTMPTTILEWNGGNPLMSGTMQKVTPEDNYCSTIYPPYYHTRKK